MTTIPESALKNYHHGNLKQALTNGFLELLTDTPIDKLSLRKLARYVGVAPTAVYNHFKNKDELAAAVKAQCLCHFGDYLDAHTIELDDPKERIKELGKAYFNYSLEYAQYFNFIMSENIPEEHVTEELLATSMRAESALRKAVIHLLERNNIPLTQYNEGLGAFACWSVAHGITTLSSKRVNHAACATGRWPPEFMLSTPDQVHTSFDAMAEILVAGILAAAQK